MEIKDLCCIGMSPFSVFSLLFSPQNRRLAKINQSGYFLYMEKSKPSCPLSQVKALVEAGKLRYAKSALLAADALGFDRHGIKLEILRLETAEFYKSMTTYRDSTTWQDVYRHHSTLGMLYIKLTVQDDVLVVSFKEL